MNEEYVRRIQYKVVVGSTAYGLSTPNSDKDRRGFFVPLTNQVLSLKGVPEQIEDKVNDEVYWEIKKFIKLCLDSNPNILDCLYTPIIEHASHIAMSLREGRTNFLSKKAYNTYRGYSKQQLKLISRGEKLDPINQELYKDERPVNWKNAMHLIRLLIVCRHLLQDGEVMVHTGMYRNMLMEIRNGETDLQSIMDYAEELEAHIDEAYRITKLPDEPNYMFANEILLKARREQYEPSLFY